MVARSAISAEGSQSLSPRPAAVASSIAGLYHRRLALRLAREVAVEGPGELEEEGVRSLHGVGVELIRHVGGGVATRRLEPVLGEAGDRRGRIACKQGGQGAGAEAALKRAGA